MTDPADSESSLLLAFVRDRDVACPLCGYNLRALSAPRCPECRKNLVLTVGLRETHVLWLMITVAPCFFSGIAAVLLFAPLIIFPGAPRFILLADAFGFASGAIGILLIVRRRAFMRQSGGRQRLWAGIAWAVHLWAFLMLLLLGFQIL